MNESLEGKDHLHFTNFYIILEMVTSPEYEI